MESRFDFQRYRRYRTSTPWRLFLWLFLLIGLLLLWWLLTRWKD